MFPEENAGPLLPPAEIRFTDVHVEPWPDGARIRVHTSLTPFQERPNLLFIITDENGDEVTSSSVIETPMARFVITMHLVGRQPGGQYTLTALLSYPEIDSVDRREIRFGVPEEPGTES